jgi:ribosomal protein L7/L12
LRDVRAAGYSGDFVRHLEAGMLIFWAMALHKLFHCPSCNAGLDLGSNQAAIVRCEYCHSVVIVPESLRRQNGSPPAKEAAKQKEPPKPVKPKLTEEEATTKVTQLARNGQTIEAMKLYRETFPVGLREAKEAIDGVKVGRPLVIPDVRWEDEAELPMEAAEEITHLAAVGELEKAAQMYRVTFGTSHVEAKTAVQQLVEGRSIDIARSSARKETQATAVRRERSQPEDSSSTQVLVVGVLVAAALVVVVLLGLVFFFVF